MYQPPARSEITAYTLLLIRDFLEIPPVLGQLTRPLVGETGTPAPVQEPISEKEPPK